MFDVSWEDTGSETVAERRQRKTGKQTPTTLKPGRRSSYHSSKSSGSSTQSKTKLSLIDRLAGTKQDPSTKSTGPMTQDCLPVVPTSGTDFNGKSSHSCEASQMSIEIHVNHDFEQLEDQRSLTGKTSSSCFSVDDSVFSQWMGRSMTAESSWSECTVDGPAIKTTEIQPLSPHSYITRSTEVVVQSADEVHPACRYLQAVHISSGGVTVVESDSDEDGEELILSELSSLTETSPPIEKYFSELMPVNTSNTSHSSSIRSPALRHQTLSHCARPGRGHDSVIAARSRAPEISGTLVKKETWKAPASWECPSDVSQLLPYPAEVLNIANFEALEEPSLTHTDRHILRMSAANPKIMLERIKEQWPEVTNSTIAQELEMEKQLWMLMGLRYMADRVDGEKDIVMLTDEKVNNNGSEPAKVHKILSLHESQASVAVLSAFNTRAMIHHLSVHPSILDNSRVQPITIPTPIPILPFPPALFSQVHSLLLPTLLPTTSIPTLLKDCHRVLTPNGSLHLTLLSPAPTPSTTGPLLLKWLEDNLLINLEAQFRCTHPSRLLPTWLNDAGFSLEHTRSRVRPVRFWALGPGEGGRWDRDGWNEASRGLNGLVAVVGRMLWKELYGEYVSGNAWWWECGDIVEECGRLGTRWDCEIMEVFKKGAGAV